MSCPKTCDVASLCMPVAASCAVLVIHALQKNTLIITPYVGTPLRWPAAPLLCSAQSASEAKAVRSRSKSPSRSPLARVSSRTKLVLDTQV